MNMNVKNRTGIAGVVRATTEGVQQSKFMHQLFKAFTGNPRVPSLKSSGLDTQTSQGLLGNIGQAWGLTAQSSGLAGSVADARSASVNREITDEFKATASLFGVGDNGPSMITPLALERQEAKLFGVARGVVNPDLDELMGEWYGANQSQLAPVNFEKWQAKRDLKNDKVAAAIEGYGDVIQHGSDDKASDALSQLASLNWPVFGFFGDKYYKSAIEQLEKSAANPETPADRRIASIHVMREMFAPDARENYSMPALQALYRLARGPDSTTQRSAYRALASLELTRDQTRDIDPRTAATKSLYQNNQAHGKFLDDKDKVLAFSERFELSVSEAVHLIIDSAKGALKPADLQVPQWAEPYMD